jgi:hypothetical protein
MFMGSEKEWANLLKVIIFLIVLVVFVAFGLGAWLF